MNSRIATVGTWSAQPPEQTVQSRSDRERFLEQLAATGQLPSPPAVVVRLLELTRRADVSARQIAETIALDPALSAKILRFVNSPLAGVAREVTSLQQAVALVGVRGVSAMALSVAILATEKSRACPGFDYARFALESVLCGVCCRTLAEQSRISSAQEAFLAGLLSQIGRAALAAAVPKKYAPILAQATSITQLLEQEKAILGQTHSAVGGWLLRRWGIPEPFCQAIETMYECNVTGHEHPQAHCDDLRVSELVRVLRVGSLASRAVLPQQDGDKISVDAIASAARLELGLDRSDCRWVLRHVSGEMDGIRTMFELPPSRMRNIAQIEAEVRERLAELSVAMHLENQHLVGQQEELLRRATTDPLTGIGNRAAFDARLTLEIERSIRTCDPLSLLMIDVDRFKDLNDAHGHLAGDRMLQAVARTMEDNVRRVDFVARYGGEEFAVIAPGTGREGVVFLAERLRQCVERLTVPWEKWRLSTTISVGAAVCTDLSSGDQASTIIRAADAQLYNAKCAGRNRVQVAVARIRDPQPAAARA